MHKKVLRWRTAQACSTSKHQTKWWVMAAMWKRQMGSARTRAMREWSANTRKAATHTAMGTNMRHCAAAGVRHLLDIRVQRRERAQEAMTMAVGIRTPPTEHVTVIIPPHLTDGSLSIGMWGTVAPKPHQNMRPDKGVARYRELAAQRKQSRPAATEAVEQQQTAVHDKESHAYLSNGDRTASTSASQGTCVASTVPRCRCGGYSQS